MVLSEKVVPHDEWLEKYDPEIDKGGLTIVSQNNGMVVRDENGNLFSCLYGRPNGLPSIVIKAVKQ